ncbi:hypothetical protein Afil01_33560 [Actinorhabdospora filicis]|uniref:AB hydrolase-1 domain-containing protein n=1 Tax=Actinorhabdospora filicis TaxID=1785913 RepID=A0A9W6SMI9_9ACTN|nr:alpha/beta fold hydrolase [Actinorhabdospora filicis]GLZ78549.1 hypothetical protein Afil01_33560 [Actinorhabdospora filicis]
MRTSLRALARLGIALAAVAGLLVLFLALIAATDGLWSGTAAWAATVATGAGLAIWRGRRRAGPRRLLPLLPVAIAAALAASVCVPTVPTDRPASDAERWELSTGSRVAVYHYPPAPGTAVHATPLVYLHGGPVRSIALIDHGFLRGLAARGYDVYAYEQAGGGRSDLLPMDEYGIDRSVADLKAFLDRLGEPADVLGFSAGAVVLTRALAEPDAATRMRRAIIAEPGPMDGPTAAIEGRTGLPNARGIAPAPEGPRATTTPRYAVAFGLMRLGLLSPETDLIGQAEGVNAFKAADLGGDAASTYCAKDADRIPAQDSAGNFSFSAAASMRVQETIRDSPSIAEGLGASTVPAMLMIAECSSQTREWATAVLAADPAIERTQYLPGVGHRLWNGLDGNDERAASVVEAFLDGTDAPLPNYPRAADILAFLADGR